MFNGDPRLNILKTKVDPDDDYKSWLKHQSILDSNMNKEAQLPHRFRETSFRFYEPFINDSIQQWPNVVKVHPEHYSKAQATFACRLRDSMRSLKEKTWSTIIDRARFLEVFPSIVVSERNDGSILIGSKDTIASYVRLSSNELPQSLPLQTTPDESFILDLRKKPLELVAELSQARKLPPRLLITGLTTEEIQWMEENYDVALDKKEDGIYILI